MDGLETRLRKHVETLVENGLAVDEAFLVAVKRISNLHAISPEFAREQYARSWEWLVATLDPSVGPGRAGRMEFGVVLVLAVTAALAVKAPELFGIRIFSEDSGFYARNFSLFVLPLLAAYFAWKRRLGMARSLWLTLPFIAAAVFANAFPFESGGATELLTALHLPIAL